MRSTILYFLSMTSFAASHFAEIQTGQCSTDGDCNSPDLYCDQAAPITQCTCASGIDKCTQLGICLRTPCSKCRTCLATTTNWITSTTATLTDPARVALAVGDYCTKGNRSPTACAAVQQLVADSWAGAVGRRAGALCVALGDCDPPAALVAMENSTCDLATEQVVPAGVVDQCTLQGTSEGVPSPDPKSVAAPVEACFKGDCSHMGAAGEFICDSSNAGQVCSCSGGKDSCERYGLCQRSPCKVCNDCLAQMRVFAAEQDTVADGSMVASAFWTACERSGRSNGVCYEVQLAIAASVKGNLGKRPAAVCRLLTECPVEQLSEANCTIPIPDKAAAVPVSELDYCTVSGFSSGNRVVGVAAAEAPLDTNRCFTTADCGSAERGCVGATDGATVCVCADGVDTCKQLGQCALTSCGVCSTCIQKAAAFVDANKASDVPTLVTAFLKECSAWGKSEGVCTSVAAAISSSFNGYMGRRAGMLCSQLQVRGQLSAEARVAYACNWLGMKRQ